MKFSLTNLLLHGSHRSYPSRRRACFYCLEFKIRWGLFLFMLLLLLWQGYCKVHSYSTQLKLSWVCKFGVEFDNMCVKDRLKRLHCWTLIICIFLAVHNKNVSARCHMCPCLTCFYRFLLIMLMFRSVKTHKLWFLLLLLLFFVKKKLGPKIFWSENNPC